MKNLDCEQLIHILGFPCSFHGKYSIIEDFALMVPQGYQASLGDYGCFLQFFLEVFYDDGCCKGQEKMTPKGLLTLDSERKHLGFVLAQDKYLLDLLPHIVG
ncbi:MAG: hypothetical protein LKE40_13070 [Spirochaetia bacterium]|jgi:hypothetical protein|nr:hypothetical protein [Spirochaetia bacterium]